jgi:hypothetical protein
MSKERERERERERAAAAAQGGKREANHHDLHFAPSNFWQAIA